VRNAFLSSAARTRAE